MPTVNIEANLSTDQLLQAVKQLRAAELDAFAEQVLALRASRQAPHVPRTEAELLLKINEGLPEDFRKRHDELLARRQAETLTPDEHRELIQMGDQLEQQEAERLEALTTLAQLRRTTLAKLMHDLGLDHSSHA